MEITRRDPANDPLHQEMTLDAFLQRYGGESHAVYLFFVVDEAERELVREEWAQRWRRSFEKVAEHERPRKAKPILNHMHKVMCAEYWKAAGRQSHGPR